MNFNELFKQISIQELYSNIPLLMEKNFSVVTSGNSDNYNSMIASGGGFGTHFKKPTNWCLFRSDRYTLELIEKEKTYTLCYFETKYNEEALFLASKSGRDSEKMKEVQLTMIETPLNNIAFCEAEFIIECKLTQVTTPNIEDFYGEARDYLREVYKNKVNYRKYVYGEITHVWARNKKSI